VTIRNGFLDKLWSGKDFSYVEKCLFQGTKKTFSDAKKDFFRVQKRLFLPQEKTYFSYELSSNSLAVVEQLITNARQINCRQSRPCMNMNSERITKKYA